MPLQVGRTILSVIFTSQHNGLVEQAAGVSHVTIPEQYVATYCNTLQYAASHDTIPLQHTATHCNTLQHAATHYNTLRVRTGSHYITLQHIALNCNTLQHTTTHRNTLTIVYKIVSVLHFGKTSARQAR